MGVFNPASLISLPLTPPHYIVHIVSVSPLLRRGCVAKNTVEWMRQAAAGLPRVPSLAFIHIPIPQARMACPSLAILAAAPLLQRSRPAALRAGMGCMNRKAQCPEHLSAHCVLSAVPALPARPPARAQFMGVWNEECTWGSKEESVNCPLIDTGIFEAFRQALAAPAPLFPAPPTPHHPLTPTPAQRCGGGQGQLSTWACAGRAAAEPSRAPAVLWLQGT